MLNLVTGGVIFDIKFVFSGRFLSEWRLDGSISFPTFAPYSDNGS